MQSFRRTHNPLVVFHHEVHNLVLGNVGNLVAQRPAKVLGNQAATTLSNVLKGFLLAFSQVQADHQAPVLPVDFLTVLGGGILGDRPQLLETGGAHGVPGDAHGEDSRAVLAGQGYAGWRLHRGHRHRQVRLLIGTQLEDGLVQFKPVALVGKRVGPR